MGSPVRGPLLDTLRSAAILDAVEVEVRSKLETVIAIMNHGRLEQWDTAYNLYHRPRDLYVADFVGEGALFRGVLPSPKTVDTRLGTLTGPFFAPVAGWLHDQRADPSGRHRP